MVQKRQLAEFLYHPTSSSPPNHTLIRKETHKKGLNKPHLRPLLQAGPSNSIWGTEGGNGLPSSAEMGIWARMESNGGERKGRGVQKPLEVQGHRPNKTSLDFEVFHILGGPDLQNVLRSAKIKVKLNHGHGEAGPPGRPTGGSVRKED